MKRAVSPANCPTYELALNNAEGETYILTSDIVSGLETDCLYHDQDEKVTERTNGQKADASCLVASDS